MSPFQYPSAPHVRRHGPRGYATAESFRPWLRDEFDFRCVYCLYREAWGRLKGAFAIDHFLPVALHPKHKGSYDNLLYACAACNFAKGAWLLPDPTQVLLDGAVYVRPDGRIDGRTPEARRVIRRLGLDDAQEAEARLLWMEIIALAEHGDPALCQRLMGYPDDLPDLGRLRPPGGNSRPEGVAACSFAQRQQGTLAALY